MAGIEYAIDPPQQQYYSTSQAAAACNIHVSKLTRLFREHKIAEPARLLDRRVLTPEDVQAIRRYLDANETPSKVNR